MLSSKDEPTTCTEIRVETLVLNILQQYTGVNNSDVFDFCSYLADENVVHSVLDNCGDHLTLGRWQLRVQD